VRDDYGVLLLKAPYGLALMALGPRQPRLDTMVQTSSRRGLSFRIPRFA